ncbi:MAG TPA: endonuclease/exonuclease/phosphatase family protein [Chitinophagaceae bacterium]
MASKFRLFTKRFFIYTNIGVVFFFLLACLAPYLNPQKWWFISFLGLAFPFLLVIVIVYLFGWIFFRKKYVLISLGALLLGIPGIGVFFSFHNPGAFRLTKEPGTIRVASWNVARFIEMKRNTNAGSQIRLKMMDQIRQQDADILCFQEFFHSIDPTWYANIDYIKEKFNYPYWYYSHDADGDKHFTGSIIFSRFPIIDSGMIRYPRPTLPDALIHADIKVNNDTFRVYTTHLQSLQFDKNDYQRIENLKEAEGELVSNSKTIFSKIKHGVTNRSIQADIINQVLDDSPHPVILCADLNDVPNSYAYATVKGDMQDAFLKKGFGIGRTFSALSPTLRIDYIFADRDFSVRQFNRIVKRYSDHYMIVADISLKK